MCDNIFLLLLSLEWNWKKKSALRNQHYSRFPFIFAKTKNLYQSNLLFNFANFFFGESFFKKNNKQKKRFFALAHFPINDCKYHRKMYHIFVQATFIIIPQAVQIDLLFFVCFDVNIYWVNNIHTYKMHKHTQTDDFARAWIQMCRKWFELFFLILFSFISFAVNSLLWRWNVLRSCEAYFCCCFVEESEEKWSWTRNGNNEKSA